MRQSHHLTIRLIGIQDTRAHSSDILCQRHHQILTDRVDGGVGHLGELLPEIVEEYLGPCGEHGQRGIVTHGRCRLLSVDGHRYDGGTDILFSITEKPLFLE